MRNGFMLLCIPNLVTAKVLLLQDELQKDELRLIEHERRLKQMLVSREIV